MADNRSVIEKQAASRLRVITARIAKLEGEKALIERLLEDNARRFAPRPINLRKNSLTKLALESEIRAFLRNQDASAKAQVIYQMLLRKDANLKGATFRSHLKRMVEAGVIEREGPRGHYQMARKFDDIEISNKEAGPPRRRVRHSFIER